MNRTEKEEFLLADIEKTQGNFDTYLLSTETYALVPSKPFNETLYQRFWAVSSDSNASAIFLNHCSGIKLAPTAAFTQSYNTELKMHERAVAEVIALFAIKKKVKRSENIPMQLLCEK